MNYCDLQLLQWEYEGGAVPQNGAETLDNEAILLQRMADYSEIRNSHDAVAMARFFTLDADLIGATGKLSKGRAAIEKTFLAEQLTVYKKSYARRIVTEIRFLSADVAIVNGSFEVSNVISIEGNSLPKIKGLFTYVWKLIEGKWLIDAYRSMSPMNIFENPPISEQTGNIKMNRSRVVSLSK